MMRIALLALVLSFAVGCGGTYDTQCDGVGGIDCELVGLPICTSSYGNRGEHAFCTRECMTNDDCGAAGVCALWKFPIGAHRVCVAPSWTRLEP